MNTAIVRPWFRLLALAAPGVAAGVARRLATRPGRPRTASVPEGAEALTFRYGLAGLRWGRSGPVVLALHGWQGRAANFQSLAARLVPLGFQVVALDAPAHGRSPGQEADPVVFADALEEVASELGPVHALVGHSMGGASLLYSLTRSLRGARRVAIAAPAGLAGVLARMSRQLGLGESARLRFFEAMGRRAGLAPERLDIEALAPALPPGELLVVHDRDDPVIPFADAERIARATRARLLATRGLGHRALLRDPAVLSEIAGFVAAPAA